MTTLPPQKTIEQERAELARRRVSLMTRRGEVTRLLRNEHVDAQERRELQEEQADLTAKIRAVESEVETLDDAEQSEKEDRKATSIVEGARRREMAAGTARAALGEAARHTTQLYQLIANAVEAVNAIRRAEAQAKAAGASAFEGFEAQDAFRQFFPLLNDVEVEKLLAEVPKGRLRSDLEIVSPMGRRVSRALAQLPRGDE